VASYLTANPQPGTYSNTNVASYLTANPQAGTYSNANVASYLTANPQAGTYSNANVASYLPTYSGNILAANIIQTATGQITTPAGSNGNITLNPDGTGWFVVTNITPAFFGNSITVKDVRDTVYTGGATTGTITPDCANGDIQTITLTGNITFNAFNNPQPGQTMTLIITQPSSGGPYTLTSTMKFAGGLKTLSTANSAIDMLHVSYIGGTYYASLVLGYA
jgi:hypothetical protein